MKTGLRICIDTRLADGPYQGAGAVVRCLVRAITDMTDGNEEYYFLAYRNSHEWLRPFASDRCRILLGPPSPRTSGLRTISQTIPGLDRALGMLPASKRLPLSDGAIEAAGIDVVHFILPEAFLTSVPSVYSPHDLQHLHMPQFFTRRARARREVRYRAFCGQADIVTIMSLEGKVDLLEQYRLAEAKVAVVPWAPAIESSAVPSDHDISEVKKRLSLPDGFVFYPAHTWPHKNHLGLLDALVVLKKRYGLAVPLICSGHNDHFFKRITNHMHQLGLESQVRFLGFVTPDELSCIYRASRFLIFPSKFEGWGLPISEAFALGTPVACSDISPLREQALGAALLFNPDDPADIATAIRRLWTDDKLRADLARQGKQRSEIFSWERTVRAFRALYRKLGNRPLTEEDHSFLSAAPVV